MLWQPECGAAVSIDPTRFTAASPRSLRIDSLCLGEPQSVTAPNPSDLFLDISGQSFEEWIALRLERLGFQVTITPAVRDGSIDLIAVRTDSLQIETRLMIQCKNHHSQAGVSVVRELRGVVPDRSPGFAPVVVCPGGFSSDAQDVASQNGIRLWSRKELEQLDQQAFPEQTS